MRTRYYDPNVGRFISEDPGRYGNNWYTYCYNNPVNKIDRNGKSPFGAAIGAIVGLVCGLISAGLAGKDAKGILVSGLIGLVAGAIGGACDNPAVAGFVGSFLGSVLGDWVDKGCSGIDFKKAFLLGVAGALIGGALGAVNGLAGAGGYAASTVEEFAVYDGILGGLCGGISDAVGGWFG